GDVLTPSFSEAEQLMAELEGAPVALGRLVPHGMMPGGLSVELRKVVEVLAGLIINVATFYAYPRGPDLPAEGLEKWDRAFHHATSRGEAALLLLPDIAVRTREAGRTILRAVSPISAALKRAVYFLSGRAPAVLVPEQQVAAARAELHELRER